MNYEDLKPWQICQLVHNHAVCNGEFEVTFENQGCQWRYRDQSISTEVFEFTMNEAKAKVKSYSDIDYSWPIIKEIFGTLTSVIKTDHLEFKDVDVTIWQWHMTHYKCNEITAAMICFLKMKDGENK